jgi:DNA-binding Lrp family transcriptional regulator
MEGYFLIEASSGMVWEVALELMKIKGMKMAHAVTGNYDVIAFAEFSDINELTSIIQTIQKIKGVQKSQTAVAMPTPNK